MAVTFVHVTEDILKVLVYYYLSNNNFLDCTKRGATEELFVVI